MVDLEGFIDFQNNTYKGNLVGHPSSYTFSLALNNESAELRGRSKMELSPAQQREINIFLSNFTEVFFQDFDSEPTNEALIDFAVMHNYWNYFRGIKVKGNYGYLEKSIVSRSVNRFFGLEVKHQKTDRHNYDGNQYII